MKLTRLWHLLCCCAMMVLLPALIASGHPAPSSGTESLSAMTLSTAVQFSYPMGNPPGDGYKITQEFFVWYSSYKKYHAGEDWTQLNYQTGGNAVNAVADGYVMYTRQCCYNPGGNVLIRHTLADGSFVYSHYGHVTPVVESGVMVTRGQKIATVYNQGGNSHLHFEIRTTETGFGGSWPGDGYTPNDPRSYGYLDPTGFIASHGLAVPVRVRVINTGAVAVRSGPSLNEAVITELYRGAELFATERQVQVREPGGTDGSVWYKMHYDPTSTQRAGWSVGLLFGRQDNGLLGSSLNLSEVGSGSPCPSSGDPRYVVFFKKANYWCDFLGEGDGYVTVPVPYPCPFLPPLPIQLPSSFDPISVRVPDGYYITLHANWDSQAAAKRYDDDANLWQDFFWHPLLGPRQIYNQVGAVTIDCLAPGCLDGATGLAVASGTCPANTPPVAPQPQTPGSGYVAGDYRAPTLCWRNRGDVEGDQLQFYAEVYDSPANASSGWIDGTCWRPSQLDYQYHSYQWRVKAKDARGAESGWSESRTFSIAAPNRPPDISFDTANGSGFTSAGIDSNARTWAFAGTASDPEGRLGSIAFRCSGEGCGIQVAHVNGANWSHTQVDMAGRNDIYFEAFDVEGHNRYSRHLDLRIDLAAPSTTLSLNSDSNAGNWPPWFIGPVQVLLQTLDGSTGSARSGVQEIRYRVDGGAWQTQAVESMGFVVSADGAHTVDYYAVDKVGNAEAGRAVTFRIDQTPPDPPSGGGETSGVIHDRWQKDQDTPTFTWEASTDVSSGVWGYQLYFGEDPAGQAYRTFTAADPREWTPQPTGVHTGVYYLRGRARDNAGNWSAWVDLFTFRYDGTPPENPVDIVHSAPITSTVWQRLTNTADFSWPTPHDEGSGIKGYYAYWGLDPEGVSDTFSTEDSFTDPTPLCPADGACTGYLRLRSVDNVDNPANEWSTGFVLRYDNAPPTVDFIFSGGITETYQTEVMLDLEALDQGSGVQAMRFSGDGMVWTAWEAYATQRLWILPGVSRQYWPVYVQVKDGVDLLSPVISHTIYLDVNPKQPRSQTFRLFDRAMSAGAGPYVSATLAGRGTMGQVADAGVSTSLHFILVAGYEAGSQALPLIEPGHGEYGFINGMFASGAGMPPMISARFRSLGTVGESALPAGTASIASAGFLHQPGFLAAQPSQSGGQEAPPSGPPPAQPPEPECQVAYIHINDGAAFTNNLETTLSLCAPQASEMMVSNDPGFVGASWEPYARLRSWTLAADGDPASPLNVYVTFRESGGTVYEQYFDNIVYDPNLPSGSLLVGDTLPVSQSLVASHVADTLRQPFRADSMAYTDQVGPTALAEPIPVLAASTGEAVTLYLDSYDDNSGVAEMQLSASLAFTDTVWQPFVAEVDWTPTGEDGIKTVYARLKDSAGNVSAASEAAFVYDTEPPGGAVALDPRIVGPSVITQSLWLMAWDNLSGMADMRISHDSTFTDTAWQPYTYTLDLPAVPADQGPIAWYVQYRDWARNVSDVYSTTYTVDILPPVVYAEVESGETLTRTVTVLAYDELSDLSTLSLSNDPLMIEGVTIQPYTDTVTWGFDERHVVWVTVEDSVGNVTEPYPAYAAEMLAPVAVTLIVRQDSTSTTLTWEHLPLNIQYEVWRSTTPYLNPDGPDANLERLAVLDPPVDGMVMMYEDASGPYYYLVRALNALGAYADSSRVGRFAFPLVPGVAD